MFKNIFLTKEGNCFVNKTFLFIDLAFIFYCKIEKCSFYVKIIQTINSKKGATTQKRKLKV